MGALVRSVGSSFMNSPRASVVTGSTGRSLLCSDGRVILRLVLLQRHCDRLSFRFTFDAVFGEEAPDLRQQSDLLVIGLNPALEAVEQIEQLAPVLGSPQELGQRHE